MQLLALAMYHRDGGTAPRVLRFRPGALNIITGESETGKSEVLDIVDYCLGRRTPNLPDEPIDQTVGWYALLVVFGDGSRMVLARPRPVGASTLHAMVQTGDSRLDVPAIGELVPNSNVAALRSEVSARLGIEDFRFQPPAGAGRNAFDVSIAHAALLCFQNQNEIADKKALFHRQTETGMTQTLKDTLPYFLGAAGPEQALRRHHLTEAARAQRAAQRKYDDALRHQAATEANGLALVRLAQNEGLLTDVPAAPNTTQVVDLLQQALAASPRTAAPLNLSDRRQGLNDERRTLRDQLQEYDEALAAVDRWQQQGRAFTGELHLQLDRLKTLALLGPEHQHDTSICPMCTQPLPQPDPSAQDIAELTGHLAEELAHAQTLQPVREEHRRTLRAERDGVAERLRLNGVQLRELMASDERMRNLQEQNLRIAHVQGRIAEALTRTGSDSDISRLRHNLALAEEQTAALQVLADEDDVAAETERCLAAIATDMTAWAKRLDLGQAADATEVSISLNLLNVVVRRPAGRLPLTRIGSAKNWIGYHLVAHLALHTYLRRNDRPVPGFLMLDQPTQAFFPERPRDASKIQDADWATVTAYFTLLNEVAQLNEGSLQIIVSDHANLPDSWFQDAVIANWRPDEDGNRNALIPPGWLG
ncbi:DUF3732 domain-containing protein [Peterkaempfera bronchialis]|uniref:DUF3732 domain-containing protein n=1 Tax=Peterkaempfera bronchialis TaxID=2126346 RepID=A0A345SQV9_9ACTN|nr:DUF3732 domain-containing protein [Peterkaempfera bronchialis]AXI76114.1 DUF3732 domain-containing protein [Peterkaempfera bronchialis]